MSEICLLCLKNNHDDKSLMFVDLTTQEWDNVTYLSKLQYVLNEEIVIYETALICHICISELNKAYDFKERVLGALDYWSGKLDDDVNIATKSDEDGATEFNDSSEGVIKTDVNVDDHQLYDSPGDVKTNTNEDGEINEGATFPCSKCAEVFLTASELMHHRCASPKTNKKSAVEKTKVRKRLKKEKADSFQCDFCGLEYTKKWKLNKHLRESHIGDKKYVCTFCNRTFKQSYHLKGHLTTHTGERNYNCNICGKTFQHLSSQSRHMRSHTALPGEKSKKSPFLCNICGKNFPYSNGAQRHMRIHTGDKRYECKICNRKFNQSTHLHVHLRTHTGERPYMCNVCGESFSIKATLDKHMKKHKDSKNDIKIFQNLEPNLSQSGNRPSSAETMKSEFVIDDIQVYDHDEYLNT